MPNKVVVCSLKKVEKGYTLIGRLFRRQSPEAHWGSGSKKREKKNLFCLFCGIGEPRRDDVGVTSELSLKQVLVAHALNVSTCG